MFLRNVLLTGTAVTLGIGLPSSSQAQQTSPPANSRSTPEASKAIQEVVVTAERRRVNLQKTALSITAVSGAKLEATGVTTFADAVQNVPSIQIQASIPGSTPGQPTFAIRGLGTDGEKPEPSVTTYLDGVVDDGVGNSFYDVDHIEVLRGPQGTLYGSDAPAGSVNILTNDPVLHKFNGSVQLEAGNYGTVHATGMVNIPINDSLALRIAGSGNSRSNYTGSGPGERELSGRVKLLYRPNDQISMILGTEQYHYNGFGFDGVRQENVNGGLYGPYVPDIGWGNGYAGKYYANIVGDVGIGILTYIPAFQHLEEYLVEGNILPGSGASENSVPYHNALTQELRLSNHTGSSISWIAGLYYYEQNISQQTYIGLPVPPFPLVLPQSPFLEVENTRKSGSYAAFSQATVPLTANFRFTGGVRYSYDDITNPQNLNFLTTFAGPPVPIRPFLIPYPYHGTFRNVDGLARIEADLTPANMVYASFATGYRPGGAGAEGSVYLAERAKSYEVGSKNKFFDDRLQVNGDLYLDDYPSLQNESNLFVTALDYTLSEVVTIPTQFSGVELETQARLTPDDTVTISSDYEKAVFTGNGETPVYIPGAGLETATLTTKGKLAPHAPKWDISASYSHNFTFADGDTLIADGDVHYQTAQLTDFGSCYYEPGPLACAPAAAGLDDTTPSEQIQRAYTLYDASLAYRAASQKYTVTLYGRNLTNVQYKAGSGTYATLGAPRTYGVILGWKF